MEKVSAAGFTFSATDDGGPAFPTEGTPHRERGLGMSLRAYFMAAAIKNEKLCSGTAADWEIRSWFGGRGGILREEIAAMQARNLADAMLAELDKP